jgi:hypothetical protein
MMIEIILKNLATTYYPRGICAMNDYEKYIETFEFKNLVEKINSAFNTIKDGDLNSLVLNELKKNLTLMDMEDVTSESSDRCLSFKASFFEGNVLSQLYLNMSVIVPYYYIYVTKNKFQSEPYRWVNLPERDVDAEVGEFNSHISFISDVIEKKFSFNRFPDNMVNTIIPDINYADVELGNFTYFNAFFLNDVSL